MCGVSTFTNQQADAIVNVLGEVATERKRQHAKWGEQDHPDGTGGTAHGGLSDVYRQECEAAFREGRGTYADILLEEVFEAMEEDDPAKLRAELIQVAAVAVAWVEAIDRRVNKESR